MDAVFFYYSIYDRFIQDNHVRACLYAFVNFFFKITSQKTIDWTFTEFHSVP